MEVISAVGWKGSGLQFFAAILVLLMWLAAEVLVM